MRVLGISCDFHDAAAAVVVDGRIVAAAEQERFTRTKHDATLPVEAVASVLAVAGLRPDDLDRVVFHEKPLTTFTRIVAARQRRGPASIGQWTREVPTFLRRNLFIGLRVERALRSLGATRAPALRFSEHHLSHASAAYYPSPFAGAAVLTVDGIGEWATATVGHGRGARIDLLAEQRYPDSLGLFYSLVTEFCGFAPNDGEYKLMGLAPFGEPTLVDRLREVVEVGADGAVTIDPAAVGHWTHGRDALSRLLGRPALERGAPTGQAEADLARSAQVLLEDAVLAMAAHAHRLTGEQDLCLAGGVALNCVANGRVLREGPFERVWVQPAAGDAGSAVGAALWLSHAVEGVPRPDPVGDGMSGALLGPAATPDEVADWLTAAEVPHRRVPDRAERAALVAERLADGAFVGWVEGPMEFGPRALGHRSILADPRGAEVQSELNLRIKERESFRPFAPAVLEEVADDWFDLDRPSPYMLFTFDLAEGHDREELPACTHVDGSARVQTVGADRDDGFRNLLEAFGRTTGCPVLLNTSFNRAGEPVVCTPADAAATARRTGLDLLVVEDCLVEVADLPEELPPGTWAQVPPPPGAAAQDRPRSPLLTVAAVAAITVLGPVLRSLTYLGRPGAAAVGVLLAACAAALWAAGDRRWPLRLATVAAGAAGCVALGGTHLGAWAAVGLVAVDMVCFGRRMAPGLPRGDTHVLPGLVVVGLVTAWTGRSPESEPALRIALLLTVVLVAVSSWRPGAVSSVAARFGHAVGHGAAVVGAAILWVPSVLLPWLAHTVVRVDPLRPGGRRWRSGWVARSSGGERAEDLWRRDPAAATPPLTWRARRFAGSCLAVGVLVLVAVPVGRQAVDRLTAGAGGAAAHRNTDPDTVAPALADSPWYPEYAEDIAWLWRTSVAWDPLAPVRLKDVRTRHINIVDGARRTWRPPACSCRRLKVWMYGGSTTFGLGQRDEHTIASELARAAWKQGVALDVDNRGVVGDHHWEEANRLAWDLATLPHPDLVVFLDGINDVQAVDRLRERTRQPQSFIKDDFWQDYLRSGNAARMDPRWAPDEGEGSAPPGASVPTTVPIVQGAADEVGRYVAQRFETARKISAAAARDAGVPVAWFWQPAIETRPRIAGEPPPKGRAWSLARYRAAAAALRPNVTDISGALDGMDEPLYWDQFHTNEKGAARVGQVLYLALARQLNAIETGR